LSGRQGHSDLCRYAHALMLIPETRLPSC
jgi:hypothetical protein